MSKLIHKTSEIALEEIREAIAELRNCHTEIQKGLTAQTYVNMAKDKLSNAIRHMLRAEDWIDALHKESSDEIQ
ncbi:hypothetical protein KTH06_10285 [Acinetobacter ursingii]|uniref:hypothetical protein n=1 Tax=Acinetobacter ursingii TaxID=108980 RepID=UPI000F76B71C|nr:hypothetical protein [Acinetobacter ursingii]MCU4306218.1 hypothetical protein [Acinetobacter ursingii]MCU4372303.1 hypothetical protein [Acinetobacter ursingii]MCU4601895.1 hypothetical protein [Acinetobacter ursingii]RSO80063.1 hypothetical protein EA748_16395 [Acinetobacter ursingii]